LIVELLLKLNHTSMGVGAIYLEKALVGGFKIHLVPSGSIWLAALESIWLRQTIYGQGLLYVYFAQWLCVVCVIQTEREIILKISKLTSLGAA